LRGLVVVKMIRPEQVSADNLERFRMEARVLARFQHPNIVSIRKVDEWDGQPYLVMEFVEGRKLDQQLKRVSPLPDEAARMVETLARAMQYAHKQGIIHRDLKPANILLQPVGAARAGTDTTIEKGAWESSLPANSVCLG